VDEFWNTIPGILTQQELVEVAESLSARVADELPRLEFPNSVALVDCRFVATKEWEHIRRYSIGGSEAAAVLSLSKFQSRRMLYHEKKNPVPENRTLGSQQILDYGHRMEDYIIAEVANRLGAKRYPEYRMFAHKDYSYITCNPDAILVFPDGHFALFESKTSVWMKAKDWKEGIPSYYEPQPRQYLEVLNDPRISEGYIANCFGALAKDIVAHKYVRDLQAGAAQIQKVVEFWEQHIVTDTPPAFSGSLEKDIRATYSYLPHDPMGDKTDALPASCGVLFERYFELQALKAQKAKEVNAAKAKESTLKAAIWDAVPEGLTVCSVPAKIAYQIKVSEGHTSTVDLQRIELRQPVVAARLQWLAENMKDTSIKWTTPKITREIAK